MVRLVARTTGGPTAGLGVLVGARKVVTCAHVVNTALGRDQREQARPGEFVAVQLEFPLLPSVPVRMARVVAWVPPPQDGAGGGDVAGLVLNEEAPAGAVPARFSDGSEVPGSSLRVFGYPGEPPRQTGSWVDVDLKGTVSGQLTQVESRDDQTVKAQPGYSGSPVWHHSSGVVVGLLQATPFADEQYRDAYLLPARIVAEAWPEPFDYLLVPENPYRGLEPFTTEHAAVFFGRERDIEGLTARVLGQPVVVLVGPSGVGKSSLVLAGLVPRLRAKQPWSVAQIRPGLDPWYRLAAGLLRAQRGTDAPTSAEGSRADVEQEIERIRAEGFGPTARFLRSEGRPLLVIVDQFEEMLADGELPEAALLDLLLPPDGVADDATRLVHTLRADFLAGLLEVPGFGSRLDKRLYLLSPLAEDQVRDAVTRPAATRGVRFQDGLADLIVEDAGKGSLPLLEFTLTRLWATQKRKTLDLAGYRAMGGVRGALNFVADQQASEFRGAAADELDRVLLRLVRTAEGVAGLTVRQRVYESSVPRAEWVMLRHLAAARLVIVDHDRVRGAYAELAHEALITAWERLHQLVRDNADFLGWLTVIRQRVSDGDPLPESRIAEARRWLDTRPDEIPETVKAFISNSQTAVEARIRELSEARHRADTARELAEAMARRAEALRLASDAEVALRSGRQATTIALALGAESVLADATLQGDLALRHVLRLHPLTLARLDHDDPVAAVAFAPDGTRVATGSWDRSARVFEVEADLLLSRVMALMTRPLSAAELRRYSLPSNNRHIQLWDHHRATGT